MTWMCYCPREVPDEIPLCAACLMERPAVAVPAAQDTRPRCADCRAITRAVQLTAGEDGVERCAGCHVSYLRERARRHPISPADLAACKAKLEPFFRQAEGRTLDVKRPLEPDARTALGYRIDANGNWWPR